MKDQSDYETYKKAFLHLITVESEAYTDLIFDSGGPTKYGVTLATLQLYRRRPQTAADVRNLSLKDAEEIYYKQYWLTMRLDGLPERLAMALFDQGVNRGTGTAIQSLQRCLKTDTDGVIGPVTRALIMTASDKGLTWAFLKECARSYGRIVQRNPSQAIFIVGWIERLNRLTERLLLFS